MTASHLERTAVEGTEEAPSMLDALEDLLGTSLPNLPATTDEETAHSAASITGLDLLERPWSALDAAGREGSNALMEAYRKGRSHLHFVRSDAQPSMLKALLRSLVPAMVEDLLQEIGLYSPTARLLAEQAAEARADEAYHRMLAGIELEKLQIGGAERLEKMADRHSRRMSQALEQLHRLRRPTVNVRIDRARNVNLGDQRIVNRSADTSNSDTPERQDGRKRASG